MQKLNLKFIFTIMIVGVILLLNACATNKQDGPPAFNVDVSRIPDATPKPERISRYGNKPVYTVFGKRYYVMPSSKNYEQQGVASWYGTKFHAQRTSNGERYDMLGMTAAHKTLPLPTYVEVTNLSNGKKVIVKVNDRGPFEANRLIDLSYVAAKKLGMLGHGTARVDVKAIDPIRYAKNNQDTQYNQHFFLSQNNPGKHTVPLHHYASTSKHAVYLQIGAFKNQQLAKNLKNRVSKITKSPVTIVFKHQLYRVQIGPIEDVAMAGRISQKLSTVGLSSKQVI